MYVETKYDFGKIPAVLTLKRFFSKLLLTYFFLHKYVSIKSSCEANFFFNISKLNFVQLWTYVSF